MNNFFNRWKNFLRVAPAIAGKATLSRPYIYILPTRYGWLFAATVIAMLAGAINYSLSLGFMMTFLLAGLGIVTMLHSWRNLAYISVCGRTANPVFAGENAYFEIQLNATQRQRLAVAAQFEGELASYTDISPNTLTNLQLTLPTFQRGWLHAPRVQLHTEFPLGLFHVWAYAQANMRTLVYPNPSSANIPMPLSASHGEQGHALHAQGEDDFAGHRAYQMGDSPRRIDWKASSREQGLLSKQYEGEAQHRVWLSWQDTPGHDAEARISQLTRWVIDAHAKGLHFGLRIPQLELQPAHGETHYHTCLKALALAEL